MRVLSLFIIGVCAAVTPFVTAMYTTFIFKLISSPVSIVSVAIYLRIVDVVVIILLLFSPLLFPLGSRFFLKL